MDPNARVCSVHFTKDDYKPVRRQAANAYQYHRLYNLCQYLPSHKYNSTHISKMINVLTY